MNVKKILLINIFALIGTISLSQVGIKIGYLSSDFSNIDNDILPGEKVNMFNNGYMAGVFYALQINGKGIVLLPEIGFDYFGSKVKEVSYKLQQISAGIPIKFYPLNLEGDCGCPDFSLRSKFFEKHFFLLLNDAVFYNVKSVNNGDNQTWDDYFSFKIGIGMGLTVPVSETIRLEPYLCYNWGFYDKWTSAMLPANNLESKSISYVEVEFGIRVGMVFE